jgi:hypothetical protein
MPMPPPPRTHERGYYFTDHEGAHWITCEYGVPNWRLRWPYCSCGLYADKCPDLAQHEINYMEVTVTQWSPDDDNWEYGHEGHGYWGAR